MATPASVLAINGGSSSIKCAGYQAGAPLKPSLSGKLDRIGLDDTAEAVALFCYQAKKRVGVFAVALGGLHTPVISAEASRVTVRVIPTDEELMIARSVSRVLRLAADTHI